jgi:exodeoxyribonuclease V beta subunit
MSPRNDMTGLNLLDPPLEGVNLIEASAGTGKTYAIAAIYLHLVMGRAIPVDAILVVTFTVAATEELRERIRAMIRKAHRALHDGKVGKDDKDRVLLEGLLARYGGARDEVLERLGGALRDFDRAAIFTIHGFCQRMLQDNAFESSALFETELLADDTEIIEEAARDFWRARMYDAPEIIARFAGQSAVSPEGLISLLRGRSLDPRALTVPNPRRPDPSSIAKAFAEAAALFESAGALWHASRGEIGGLVASALDKKILSGQKIRRASLDNRLAEQDGFLDGGDPFVDWKYLDYFTAGHFADSTNAGKEPPRHRFLDHWQRFTEARGSVMTMVRDHCISLKIEFLEGASPLLARSRERRNARTFNDLLTEMHRALGSDPSSPLARRVRARFRAALIDEFQDTDPLQYEIFSTIFGAGGPALFMIGDPKQAIYRFRGADIFAYLRAAGHCDRRWSLAENHRSDPALVAAVNAIFSRLAGATGAPFVLDGIGFTEVRPALKSGPGGSPPLTIWFIDERYADNRTKSGPTGRLNRSTAVDLAARHTALETARLLAAGESAADIAVLVRTHRQAGIVTGHLRRLGVPCVAYGTESVFQTREALEMERVLAAIAEPSDRGTVNAALATEFWGKSGAEIARIAADEEELSRAASAAAIYRAEWERRGFMPMFSAMLRDLEARTRLISLEDGERRLTNVLHLAEALHRAEQQDGLGIEGLLKWLRTRRAEAEGGEETKIRLETDDKAVRVITMHKSKGLEFPIVFCPCLFDPVVLRGDLSFHHPGDDHRPVLDLGTEGEERAANEARARAEELSESMRLMYVALTRAKQRCYLAWGHINGTDLSAPFYAFHHGRMDDRVGFLETPREGDKKKKPPLTHGDKLADLQELESAAKGAILVTGLPGDTAPRYRPAAAAPAPECREFTGTLARRWSLTSFSSLVFSAGSEHDGRDRDPSAAGEDTAPADPGRSIHGFPRGTRAGLLIHSIFEELDFAGPDSADTRKLIDECLMRHRFEPHWREALVQMAHNVLTAPLDNEGAPFRLADIAPASRLHELDFYFPASGITPAGLAELVLGKQEGLPGDAAGMAARLGIDPVNGFVRGFIDLVFSHGGRYYILDWKSNHLGASAKDYTRERMASAMAEHYYHLQYHIYSVALHRHLKRSLPGYSYAQHFGGAFYLFVRGMDPAAPGCGIFYDRPGGELMARLDAYIAGGNDVG